MPFAYIFDAALYYAATASASFFATPNALVLFMIGIVGFQTSYNPEYSLPNNYLNSPPLGAPWLSYNYTIFGKQFSYPYAPDTACNRAIYQNIYSTSITADYLIVGAGPAGLTVAYRLNQKCPTCKIFIIESGGLPNTVSVIPLFSPYGLDDTMWNYAARPSNKTSKAFRGGRCPLPQGRVLGGGSVKNAMQYLRGVDIDFYAWATKTNNSNWSFSNVLKYFLKTENNTDPSINNNTVYHSKNGSVTVSTTNTTDSSNQCLAYCKEGFLELGYQDVTDYNAGPGHYNGITLVQHTIKDGERESAIRAYQALKYAPNVYILYNTTASKINFKNRTAISINVVVSETLCSVKNFTININKKLIVSAGALGSAKLLQLSGVGDPAVLEPLGITPVANLSVGKTFEDHPMTHMFYKLPNATAASFISEVEDGYEYFSNRTGDFSTWRCHKQQMFINTENTSAPYPDVQIAAFDFKRKEFDFETIAGKFGWNSAVVSKLNETVQNYGLLWIIVLLLKPKSTGRVSITSTDPLASLDIDSRFLEENVDLQTLIRGMQTVRAFANTTTMRNIGAELLNLGTELGYCSDPLDDSCYISYFTGTNYHACCTNPMGLANDTNSVVDGNLKLIGFTNTFVADLSVMPNITRANTQSAAYMIGEVAADLVYP